MKNKLYIFSIAFIFALLVTSCGDDSLVDEADQPTIIQHIFVLPERFNGEPYNYGQPPKTAYVDVDEVVKFSVGYSVSGYYVSTSDYDTYIQSKQWNINGEHFNVNSFRYAFAVPGHYQISVSSIDFMNDTITSVLDIYVNTPISTKLVFPENGYNLVDPVSEDGIDIKWNVYGVDEWETTSCDIFASFNKEDVWDSPQAQNDCKEPIHIIGPIAPDIDEYSSKHIYWAVIATNRAKNGWIERDTTPIFEFSTKFHPEDLAAIQIPINYTDYSFIGSVNTKITLLNADGDTLDVLSNFVPQNSVTAYIKPQLGVKIIAEELTSTDFQSDSTIINVPEAASFIANTLTLIDNVPPVVTPFKEAFDKSEQISFLLIDNGTGINWLHFGVSINDIPLETTLNSSRISFTNPCKHSCYATIQIQDNANNVYPELYWHLSVENDSVYVTGPFNNAGK